MATMQMKPTGALKAATAYQIRLTEMRRHSAARWTPARFLAVTECQHEPAASTGGYQARSLQLSWQG